MTPRRHILSRIAAAVATVTALALPAEAQEFEKNIMTGGPSGTYIQFGRDVSAVAAECGLTLNVVESAGSLENFLAVRKRRFTQFGIVQSDVLEYLQTYASDDPDIARAIAGVRIMYPLYNEEVHVLATREVEGLQDLSGRRVAVGVEDSGTFLTASLILDLVGAEPAERVTIGPDASLEALLAGEIDAFFYVAGAPTALFQNPQIDGERFHLLPISDPTLQAVYVPATIPAGAYPFQDEAIDIVAVKAVLMTYEYNPRRNPYHRASCEAVADISHLILTRFDRLRGNGHPKWQQVDLNDLPPGWEVGDCVNDGLATDYVLQCGDEPTRAPSIESQANDAYRTQICATIGC
ncbi:TAXI family TRAP transporter solute-binding subunit [Roseitranquillus sediminis]|uniref:TAXI family TRAP transporter solute-binding subunit n=1 Tax=Roseitranquillus sediminis TaxID=2809051 RepID=UPI001D0C95A5|nr:TAXI family TRAP transporter solute-binding subunit [Roseitranquillus sediminis]MBM9594864.1 TAXI family TRAP transporter solute-binding subunit [Roseitranquillus sediminis]